MGGTREDPPTCKMGTFFHMSLTLNFEKKNLYNRVLNNFFVQSLRLGHLPPFDWKLFKLGSVSVSDITKNVPILQVGGSSLAPPIPPVFRVVLLHKWRFVQSFNSPTVHNGL